MNHKLRVLFYVLLAVVLALIATGEQPSLAEGSIIYVDADATGANNGSSWADAFLDLQPALDAAVAYDEIWVAEGTYLPTHEFTPGDSRSASFQMKNGVAIYGGFNGTETNLTDRDWVTNPTILSCDLYGDDGADFTNNAENCYHVFYHPDGTNLDSTAILDGFTIRGGNANAANPHYSGGGMYNSASSPTVINSIFSGNFAAYYGGGMYNFSSSPILTNCTFVDNSAGIEGGGISNITYSSPQLSNCVFQNNSADHGGGMGNQDHSSPILTNCIFWNNSANYGAGVYNLYYASPQLTNCTFWGNSASNAGGGMYNDNGYPVVMNSIFWGDTPREIYPISSAVVTYSDIQAGYPGTGNIAVDPLFIDPAAGDFHLGRGSPCIDAGDNTALNLPLSDFEGDARIVDGNSDGTATVDMGVDELDQAFPTYLFFVDQDASGADNGTSWTDAFTSLQSALEAAANGDQIWVSAGTYKPTVAYGGTGDRYKTFQMRRGVAIYGGFSGSESSLDERDWISNLTILSGDLGVEGENTDNSYHVIYNHSSLGVDSSAILDGFTITGGNANDDYFPFYIGGGMFNNDASPTLVNITFTGNSANSGGGMSNHFSSPILVNCTFWGNSANYGGGMGNYGSSPILTNCTFTGNIAVISGGGLSISSYSSPVLINSILWGNLPQELDVDYESTPDITFSDIQGGYTGTGNIDANPFFVDAGNGDLHLSPGSPVIDSGNNAAPYLPLIDYEGDMRIIDGDGNGIPIVDMGVDETQFEPYIPGIIYVDQDATGANTGTSWTDAFTALPQALDSARSGDQIWVGEGTYIPTADGNRFKSFRMINEVAIYGGFDPSIGAVTWEDRNWINHETILSCDLNGDDGPDFANNAENCYHVFYHPASITLNGTAVLDGFTITGGNADGDYTHIFGGGMYNDNASPSLSNCTFSNNFAYDGGGMYNDESSPTIADSAFIGNIASFGSGMTNNYNSSPTLTHCLFSNNTGASDGGGMSNYSHSSPTVNGCMFLNNSASEGGGMHNDLYSSPLVVNSIFAGNSAYYGGGMYNSSSAPKVINATFTGNQANFYAGGIYNLYSNPTLTNIILWGNTPGEIYNMGSTPVVTYSDVQGGYTGSGNIALDPLFVDPANGDYHLGIISPCIDSGTFDVPGLPTDDFEGDLRIIDGNGDGDAGVDIGADEYSGPILVEINIKPSSKSNTISLNSHSNLQVAILTSTEFDATSVDPATVLLASAEPVSTSVQDVDKDGDLDLLLTFQIQELDLDESSTEAVLTGETYTGIAIIGWDMVNTIP